MLNSKSLANLKSSWSEDPTGSDSNLSNIESETKPILENARQDKAEVYWISYMEGEQRVLLFTQHESVFSKVKGIIDPETSKREIFLSIVAIGVSVVSKHDFRRNRYCCLTHTHRHIYTIYLIKKSH